MATREVRLGELIRRARKEVNLSQEEVGKAIGMDQSSVSDMESGKTIPNVFDLLAVARITQRGLSFFVPEYDSRLSEDEQQLVQAYRDLGNDQVRRIVLNMVRGALRNRTAVPLPSVPPGSEAGRS